MTRVIRKLIDIGADLTSADMNGNTILHVAAESGINISLKEIFTMTNCRDFENFSLTLQSLLGVKNYEGKSKFLFVMLLQFCVIVNYPITILP